MSRAQTLCHSSARIARVTKHRNRGGGGVGRATGQGGILEMNKALWNKWHRVSQSGECEQPGAAKGASGARCEGSLLAFTPRVGTGEAEAHRVRSRVLCPHPPLTGRRLYEGAGPGLSAPITLAGNEQLAVDKIPGRRPKLTSCPCQRMWLHSPAAAGGAGEGHPIPDRLPPPWLPLLPAWGITGPQRLYASLPQ